MYNEGDYEIKRLLQSLFRVAWSHKLRDVYIEIHIFLDNGSQDGHLNVNARRLVDQVAALNKDANFESLEMLTTPYGLQMTWTLGKHCLPFFVHFKDSNKFKTKKRWSQVMYMNYILNYRCKFVNKMASKMMNQQNTILGQTEEEHKRKNLKGFFFGQSKETTKKPKQYTVGNPGKPAFAGSERNPSGKSPNNMAAALDAELEQLRVLLNVRRCDSPSDDKIYRPFDEYVTSTSGHKTSSSRRSYLHQNACSPKIALSVSNILSLVLNGRCSNQCLNFSLTHKPFLATTSEESSGEDEVSTVHSEAYTVSGESSAPSDEVYVIDGDTDGEVDADEEDEDLTDKSNSCDDCHSPANWKLSIIHTKRNFKRSDRQHLDEDRERYAQTEADCSKKFTSKISDVEGGYFRGAPLTVPTASVQNGNKVNRMKSSLHGISRDYLEPVTSSTHNYCFDLRPRGSKSFQHQDKPNRHHRQRFWLTRRPSCSSFCSSHLSSTSSHFDRTEEKNNIFTITNGDSMNTDINVNTFEQLDTTEGLHFDDQTYILATDSDMEFDDSSLCQLLDLCNHDKRVGGACGRTHPVGQRSNPVVWYQKFEYAKGKNFYITAVALMV